MGMSMPSWFDILSFGFDSDEDERGMLQTAHSLNQLITAEMDATGVPAARIVLGGFSQGGSMSLLTGLTSERRLAGVAVLSGWTPLRKKFKSVRVTPPRVLLQCDVLMFMGQMVSEHATSVPIFWGHGTLDSLVKHTFGVESVEWIKRELKVKPTTLKEGADLKGVAFNSYVGMGHSTDPKELADLSGWLQRVIPKEEEEKEAEKEKEKGEP
jgi:lysophospholipase-1